LEIGTHPKLEPRAHRSDIVGQRPGPVAIDAEMPLKSDRDWEMIECRGFHCLRDSALPDTSVFVRLFRLRLVALCFVVDISRSWPPACNGPWILRRANQVPVVVGRAPEGGEGYQSAEVLKNEKKELECWVHNRSGALSL
jgi:hypothetical protein